MSYERFFVRSDDIPDELMVSVLNTCIFRVIGRCLRSPIVISGGIVFLLIFPLRGLVRAFLKDNLVQCQLANSILGVFLQRFQQVCH